MVCTQNKYQIIIIIIIIIVIMIKTMWSEK